MELLSYTIFDLIVYVEWESRVNFVTYIKVSLGASVTILTCSHI